MQSLPFTVLIISLKSANITATAIMPAQPTLVLYSLNNEKGEPGRGPAEKIRIMLHECGYVSILVPYFVTVWRVILQDIKVL